MVEWTKNQRKVSLALYKNNPTLCKNCGCCLLVLEKDKVAIIKNKKFCSSKCSAQTSNKTRSINFISKQKLYFCEICKGKTSKKNITICRNCKIKNIQNIILNKTKGELLETIKNGRWDLYRVRVNRQASRSYRKSSSPKFCKICGYNKFFQVAHIKAVSAFDEKATLGEINSLDNLVALCPNHHWEYDNGLITLESKSCGAGNCTQDART